MSTDEGDEEGMQQPLYDPKLLEDICKAEGQEHFTRAVASRHPVDYLAEVRLGVEQDFKNNRMAHESINNFLVDSYLFWSRNAEVATRDRAVLLAVRDTMQYLVLLKSGFPFLERPRREDWGYEQK